MGGTGGGLSWNRCFLCSSPVEVEGFRGGGGDGVVGAKTGAEGELDCVKLLIKYLLHDVKLETRLSASVIAQWGGVIGGSVDADAAGVKLEGGEEFSAKLCAYCSKLVKTMAKLQVELEAIQTKLVNHLEDVKKAVISNSRLYGVNDEVKHDFGVLEEKLLEREGDGEDCSAGRRFLDVLHHFQTFVFENETKYLHIPLDNLEYVAGRRIPLALTEGLLDKHNEIKNEIEDYSESLDMELHDLNFDLPESLPHVKMDEAYEEPATTTKPRRKSTKLAPAPVSPKKSHKLKKASKLASDPIRGKKKKAILIKNEKKSSSLQPKPKQRDESRTGTLLRYRHAKYSEMGDEVNGEQQVGTRKNEMPDFKCEECGFKASYRGLCVEEQHLKQHETTVQNYECSDCKIGFTQKQYFELHLSYHHHTLVRKCDICAQRVQYLQLKTHLKTHQDKIFGCKFCSLWTPTFEALAIHLQGHPKVSVKCELCPEEDSQEYRAGAQPGLRRHLAEAHGKTQFELKCPVEGCSELFYGQKGLAAHIKMHQGVHACSVCGKSFGCVADLDRHIRREHPAHITQWLRCDACDAKFTTDSALLRHQILEHNKPKLKCEQCEKEFVNKSTLYYHLKIHHQVGKGPKYACEHCGKTFHNKQVWTMHEASHKNERSVTCEICGFATNSTNNLRRHKIHHEKRERKYPCPHCTDRFYDNYTLILHMRRHTGERPYQCDKCGSTFTQKSALNLHKKKHVDGGGFVPRGPRASGRKIKTSGDSSSSTIPQNNILPSTMPSSSSSIPTMVVATEDASQQNHASSSSSSDAGIGSGMSWTDPTFY